MVNWGDNVAVFGLGAIGNFVAQWAKVFGAKHIFAVDMVPEKVEIARKIGLKDAICGKDTDVEKFIKEKTGDVGVNIAFEASGAQAAFTQAVSVLGAFSRLGLVGRPLGGVKIDDKTFEKILRAQITIKGTWSFEFTSFPHHAWNQSIDALRLGEITTEYLITHIFPLDKTFDAIKMMSEKKEFTHKILIKP